MPSSLSVRVFRLPLLLASLGLAAPLAVAEERVCDFIYAGARLLACEGPTPTGTSARPTPTPTGTATPTPTATPSSTNPRPTPPTDIDPTGIVTKGGIR